MEIGLLRAYDMFRFDENNAPVWSLAIAYFNCDGASKIKPTAERLAALGYRAAVLCDSDAPEHLSREDIEKLKRDGIHVTEWAPGNATEHQLFAELPWQHVPKLLTNIANDHDSMESASMINAIIREPRVAALNLANDPRRWSDTPVLRKVLGNLAHQQKWIKRLDYARKAFEFALPKLPDNGVLKTRLAVLWNWIQSDE